MKTVSLTEKFFEGAVSVEKNKDGLRPWRLPYDRLVLFPPDDGVGPRAGMTSGVRLRFRTSATAVGLRVAPYNQSRKFDLVIDNQLLQTLDLPADGKDVVFAELPSGRKSVEIWLPSNHPVRAAKLLVSPGATAAAVRDDRPKWITYGSSISHCGGAHSGSRTWPAVAARMKNLNLMSLGYGGQCHLDVMVARMIRDLPADFISLKVGINVHGGSSLTPRTFRAAIVGFVQILREKHRDIPIALVSPIISPPRENTKNNANYTLSEMREHVKEAADRLRAAGDKKLFYVSGLDLFGPDLVEKYLPDNLHPNGDGYEILGRNFAEKVLSQVRL